MEEIRKSVNEFAELFTTGEERPRNRPAELSTNCNCPMGALARLVVDALLADLETSFTTGGRFPSPESRIRAARRCNLLAEKLSRSVTGTDPISSEIRKSVESMIIAPVRNIASVLLDAAGSVDIEDIVPATTAII
ncbi:MAG: hypothetical protein WC552_09505 [Candidatus Omnitrophota bacterium]